MWGYSNVVTWLNNYPQILQMAQITSIYIYVIYGGLDRRPDMWSKATVEPVTTGYL